MNKPLILAYSRTFVLVFVILYLSFANSKQFEGAPSFFGIDKLVHFILYALLSVFIFIDTKNYVQLFSLSKVFWVAFVGSIVLGGVVEIMQGLFFATRSAEWGDFVFDFFGALLASYLIYKYYKAK